MGLHFSGQSTGHRRVLSMILWRMSKIGLRNTWRKLMCIYLVFDRYDDFSTKSVARGGRETGVTRTHQLRIETKLPAQNVVLTVPTVPRVTNWLLLGNSPVQLKFRVRRWKRDVTWRLTMRKPTTWSFGRFWRLKCGAKSSVRDLRWHWRVHTPASLKS